MYLVSIITALAALSSSVAAASFNSSREFKLYTKVKPGQSNKQPFDSLWLSAYHSGAGENDAVLLKNASSGNLAFFNRTSVKRSNGKPFYDLVFDLGTNFPWSPQLEDVDFYASFLPVAINAGNSTSGGSFYFNQTGLQFDMSPGQAAESNGFGGWLVCNWWRGVPQLFVKLRYYPEARLCNCAEVYLLPKNE